MKAARFSLAAVAAGVAAVLLLPAGAGSTPPASVGYVIQQRQGTSRTTVMVSTAGYETVESVAAGSPALAAFLRYSDRRVFLLDPASHTYSAISLAAALKARAAEHALVAHAQAAFEGEAAPKPPASHAVLRPLRLTASIHGLAARAYLLRDGMTTSRLWYATDVPAPPADVQPAIAAAAEKAGSGSPDRALRFQQGHLLLRLEIASGRHWKRALDTISVVRRSLPASFFAPPSGWKAAQTSAPTPKRFPAAAREVPANAVEGPGPRMADPEVYAIYYGRAFHDHPTFVQSMNNALHNLYNDEFKGWLAGYGISGAGHVLGSGVVNDNPPAGVGSDNLSAIGALVLTSRWFGDAPKFWFTVGGHDPLLAFFVPESVVDTSGWDGMHMFTPTEAALVPFPFNFFVHDAMPWLLVKVPDKAFDAPATFDRSHCAQAALEGRTKAADCNAIDGFDAATERLSHEFVETITDPYPFTGTSDPLQQPAAQRSEIGDICESGEKTAPWGHSSAVAGTAVDTYWSNNAHACVPESQPSISIVQPSDGASVLFHRNVTIQASTSDPLDGSGSAANWQVDGRYLATTTSVHPAVIITPLSPGKHTLTARMTDTQGLSATAQVTITIAAYLPTVTIVSPQNGAAFSAGQQIGFFGNAQDPQDGALTGNKVSWTLDGAPFGQGTSLKKAITVPGDHVVGLSATDSAGLTGTASIKLHITATPPPPPPPPGTKPDLIVASIDGAVAPGELLNQCQVTFTVKNIGNATADPSTTDVHGNQGIAVRAHADVSTPQLAPGQSIQQSATIGLGCNGTDIIVTADTGDVVDESNEDNNFLGRQF